MIGKSIQSPDGFGGSSSFFENLVSGINGLPFDKNAALLGSQAVQESLTKRQADAIDLANVLGGGKAKGGAVTTPFAALATAKDTVESVASQKEKFNKLLDNLLNRNK